MDNFTFGMFGELESYNDQQELNEWHDMIDSECDDEFFELPSECDIDYDDNYLSGEEDFA